MIGKQWIWALIVSVTIVASSGGIWAWDGHELITEYSLEDIPLLHSMELAETEYTYERVDQSVYNPAFQLSYLHSETEEFTAFDVVSGYAQEPDWDLDTDLQLDKKQAFTGGSQGWRHQRYTLLNGLVALGIAPERAEHFYDLALFAYEKGDLYWAFRFLSRSLHYLQDMGQPFHSLPMPVSHFLTRHRLNLNSATLVGENIHFNLEWYVQYQLARGYKPFVQALQGSDYVTIGDVRQAATDLNGAARKLVNEQYNLVSKLWPQLSEVREVRLDFERNIPETGEDLARLHAIIGETLQLSAAYSRGLLLKFLEDVGIKEALR